MNIRNPFGIVEGKLKHIKDINKGDKIICPICNENLVLKYGKERVKHLSHANNEVCGGESDIHRLIKEYIYENIKNIDLNKHKIDKNFCLCHESERLYVKKKAIECRGISNKYIPDIMLKTEGNFNIAIEICYKNKKDRAELIDILENTIVDQVYEIDVKDKDIESMDIKDLMERKKLIYGKLERSYVNKLNYINNLEMKNEELRIKITESTNMNSELEKILSKYKNSDIEKLRWQIEMQKNRIALLLEK